MRQRPERARDIRRWPLRLAQAEITFIAHGATSRVQREFLHLVAEVDEHIAETDEVGGRDDRMSWRLKRTCSRSTGVTSWEPSLRTR